MRLQKDAKIDLLKNVPLFAGCSKTELQRIASLADELDLGDGATLIREGERGREFIVIAEGTVKVTRSGKQLRELGAGDFIGEIALVADVPRTATAWTLAEPDVVICLRCAALMRPSGNSTRRSMASRFLNASTAAAPVSPDVAARMVAR